MNVLLARGWILRNLCRTNVLMVAVIAVLAGVLVVAALWAAPASAASTMTTHDGTVHDIAAQTESAAPGVHNASTSMYDGVDLSWVFRTVWLCIAPGLMEALIAGKDEDHGCTEEVFARAEGAGDAFGAGCATGRGDEPGVDGEDRRPVRDPSRVAQNMGETRGRGYGTPSGDDDR
jgi:hypothetical protein